MPWARLDDNFSNHPKFVALEQYYGNETETYMAAIGLWASALAYCSAYLTDGDLAKGAIRRIYPGPPPEHLIDGLIHVGLWNTTANGWQVVDYTQRNDTAAEVRAKRDQAIRAGKASADARAGKGPWKPPPSDKRNPPSNGQLNGPFNGEGERAVEPSHPIPSHPIPSTTDSRFVGEISSSSSGGPGETDDDERIQETLRHIGVLRHQAEAKAGHLRKQNRSSRRRHREVCVDNALAEPDLRQAVHDAIHDHPDWTPEQVAEHVEAGGELATVHSLPAPCGYCGGTHTGECVLRRVESGDQ